MMLHGVYYYSQKLFILKPIEVRQAKSNVSNEYPSFFHMASVVLNSHLGVGAVGLRCDSHVPRKYWLFKVVGDHCGFVIVRLEYLKR